MQVFPLPSRGKIYPEASPLRSGEVKLRPMVGEDEEILATNQGDAIDRLLEQCLDGNHKAQDFYSEDKMYLLLMLRAISYGEHFPFKTRCQHCGATNDYNPSLLKDIHVNMLEQPGPFSLELGETEIEWDFIDGVTEKKVSQRAKRNNESEVTLMRAAAIVSIDGKSASPSEAIEFVRKAPVKHLRTLRQAMEEKAFGIVEKMLLECHACNQESEVPLALSADFFCPT